MAAKICIRCKVTQKAPGKQKCHECLLAEQSPTIRERDADRRLGCIPVELRRARVPKEDWPTGRRWCSGCQSFIRLVDCGKGSRCLTCAGRVGHASMLERTYFVELEDGTIRPFTLDDYNLMYREQNGRCRICLRKSVTKRMAVDHDHVTNLVRGLLCPGEFGCNFAILGNIKDLAMAKRIVEYLETPPAKLWIKR